MSRCGKRLGGARCVLVHDHVGSCRQAVDAAPREDRAYSSMVRFYVQRAERDSWRGYGDAYRLEDMSTPPMPQAERDSYRAHSAEDRAFLRKLTAENFKRQGLGPTGEPLSQL